MSKPAGAKGNLFEALEGRLLLSGDMFVSVTRGNLRISGDSADNDVVISQGATADEFVISSGVNATTFSTRTESQSPGPITVTGVTRDITVLGRGGADIITFQANAPRSLFLNGGSGNNTLVAAGAAVKDVKTSSGDGDDNVGISMAARNVSINNGFGDNVTLVDQTDLTGSLTVKGSRRSADTVTVNDSIIDRSLTVRNGSGLGTIDVIGMTGSVNPIPVTVGNKVSLSAVGTINVDQLTCTTLVVSIDGTAVITNVSAAGSVDIDSRNNSDTIGISGLTAGRNLSIDTRSGNDVVSIDNVTINGRTSINTSNGDDTVAVEAEDVVTGTTSTFVGRVSVSTGRGNDTMQVGNKARTDTANDFLASVKLNMDGGIDTLDALNNGNVFAILPVVLGNPTVT